MVAAGVPPSGWGETESPFHTGERAVQARLGVRGKMEAVGRKVIRRQMPEQHRTFYAQLPFVFAGTADPDGQPWAGILAAAAGFLYSPDPDTLRIDITPAIDDPLARGWHDGAAVGLLGIEPPTRRRNRVNGTLAQAGDGWRLSVAQSFGNCPKYIQARDVRWVGAPPPPPAESATTLGAADRALIAAADTFFIASTSADRTGPAGGTDVSHRGGKPGFVRIDDARTLTTPDFVGNWLFNTIGNLVTEPRAGLLFIDWARGDLLHLAVDSEIIWDGAEVEGFDQAQRLVRFHVRQVIRRAGALALRWSEPEPSPFLIPTGVWPIETKNM